MNHTAHAKRRQRVLDSLGDGVAVLATAPERLRNRDSHYPYRFDSYFWYLSGFAEPDAVMVLVGGEGAKAILFCREKNEERETWDGFRYGPEAAAAAFGFCEAHPIGLLDEMLPRLIANRAALWHSLGHDSEWDRRITSALNAVRTQGRSGTRAPGEIRDLRGLLDQMRLIKDGQEIELMRRAADIASAGHSRAMRACKPGMAEYELEAELSYEFRRRGADGGPDHDDVLAEPVHQAAERHAQDGHAEHVGATHDRGGEDRARLEVGPEGDAEPQEARGEHRRGGVAEHVVERAGPVRLIGDHTAP